MLLSSPSYRSTGRAVNVLAVEGNLTPARLTWRSSPVALSATSFQAQNGIWRVGMTPGGPRQRGAVDPWLHITSISMLLILLTNKAEAQRGEARGSISHSCWLTEEHPSPGHTTLAPALFHSTRSTLPAAPSTEYAQGGLGGLSCTRGQPSGLWRAPRQPLSLSSVPRISTHSAHATALLPFLAHCGQTARV